MSAIIGWREVLADPYRTAEHLLHAGIYGLADVDVRIAERDCVILRLTLVVAFVVSLILACVLYWLLTRTDFGRSVRAIHQNPRAAALMGINVTAVRTITFAAGFGILAIAAGLLLPGTPAHPGMGLRYTVITLMVIILGGMTNFFGIILGGFLIGVSEAIGTVYVSGIMGMMMPYAIFVLVLLFRPQGILRRAS